MTAGVQRLYSLIDEYMTKNCVKWSTETWLRAAWKHLIDMDLAEFNYCEAEDYRERLYQRGFSASTVKSYMKAVQLVMNWSWRRGYRSDDPFARLKKPRIPQQEIRVFSHAELCDMLAAAPNDRWRAMIMTAVTAGLRKSEVLNLTIRDIDFEKGFIRVQAKKETPQTWPWATKSYACRRVPLTEETNKMLVKRLDELPAGQPYLMLTEKRYWTLQQKRQKGSLPGRLCLRPDENWRPWDQIMGSVGIEGTFHDLRRTCITAWTRGLAPQEVQKLAGHASITTTMEYYAAVGTDVLDRARTIGATRFERATS